MNEIKFQLSKEQLFSLKRFSKLGFAQNLLIKTNNNKNIIIAYFDYKNSDNKNHHFILTTDYKSEKEFMVLKNQIKIESISGKKTIKTQIIAPILIPPVDEYEVTILLKENILRMKSKSMSFEFLLDEFPLTSKENHLPN
jgi:hypothetical protein